MAIKMKTARRRKITVYQYRIRKRFKLARIKGNYYKYISKYSRFNIRYFKNDYVATKISFLREIFWFLDVSKTGWEIRLSWIP